MKFQNRASGNVWALVATISLSLFNLALSAHPPKDRQQVIDQQQFHRVPNLAPNYHEHDVQQPEYAASDFISAKLAVIIAFVGLLVLLVSVLGYFFIYCLLNVKWTQKLFSLKTTECLVNFYYRPMICLTIAKVYFCCGKYRWYSQIDDRVYLGMLPHDLLNPVSHLYHDLRVRGVVNLMAEDAGPEDEYAKFGIEQLHLPTVDHFSPSKEQLAQAVAFMQRIIKGGDAVYVHCKAGHGRSAAVAMAWLLSHRNMSLTEAQDHLNSVRDVRKELHSQDSLREYGDMIATDVNKS